MRFETPLREEHERLGAAMGDWFGTALPAAYGKLEEEYRCARENVAVVDTTFQLVAELTGPDRARYLNAVTSGNIRDLAEGQSALGLLLNPQGRIQAEIRTLALADRFVLHSHAMARERTLATLDKFIIMDDVTLTDRTEEFASVAVIGAQAGILVQEVAGADLAALAAGGHTQTIARKIPCRVLHATSLGLEGAEFLAPREQAVELWSELVIAAKRHGGRAAGYRAIEALRLEMGVPWFGADFDEHVIPHEAGLETSHISYVKGCYTGQEIVERVRSRGQVNRRRVVLSFTDDALPEPGAKLLADGTEVGAVTSAAPNLRGSPIPGRGIGMGYLRREFTERGARLEWQGGQAEVIELPALGAV